MTESEYRYLISPEGCELYEKYKDDVRAVRQPEKLIMIVRKNYPVEAGAVIRQIALHKKAEEKLGAVDGIVLTEEGLAQSTRSEVAQYISRRFRGIRVLDGTAGIGGDSRYLLTSGGIAVEKDPITYRILGNNLKQWLPTGDYQVVCGDVQDISLEGVEALYLDPARRDAQGRRSSQIRLWNPNVAVMCAKAQHAGVSLGIKMSPVVSQAEREALGVDHEWEVISWGRKLKQGMFWTKDLRTKARRRATLLPSGFTLTDEVSAPIAPISAVKTYIVEPNSAILRAGLIDEFCYKYGLWRIDPMVGYCTTNVLPELEHSDLARLYRVVDIMKYNIKQLKKALQTYHPKGVEIRRRGFPEAPEVVRAVLGIPEGDDLTLLLTRIGPSLYGMLVEKV